MRVPGAPDRALEVASIKARPGRPVEEGPEQAKTECPNARERGAGRVQPEDGLGASTSYRGTSVRRVPTNEVDAKE